MCPCASAFLQGMETRLRTTDDCSQQAMTELILWTRLRKRIKNTVRFAQPPNPHGAGYSHSAANVRQLLFDILVLREKTGIGLVSRVGDAV